MKVGVAADHGGFELKEKIREHLEKQGHSVTDFGAHTLDNTDDYPDFVIPLARAVSKGEVERGIAVCGSGVGAAYATNKIPGVRAALINEYFSAHQGVEDDNMNIICLGGRVTGYYAAEELVDAFMSAKFSGLERHNRRIKKITDIEKGL